MKIRARLIVGVLSAGLLVVLVVSCGDDGTSSPQCTNCSFWSVDYGGVGRYPAVSPDPSIIAISSRYVFPSKIEFPFDPDDLPVDDHYHIWIAETEEASDTVWYYRITSDSEDDNLPEWSVDGQTIVFGRSVGAENERQVFFVDVSDFSNPGTPVQVTDESFLPPTFPKGEPPPPHTSENPSWVTLAGQTWIAVASLPKGKKDSDIGLVRYPAMDETIWVSIDPADFAKNEGGVMSYTFEDLHPTGNGGNLIAFASPNRQRVAAIEVIAKSEEQDDSLVVAPIFINGKPSNQFTPYTFQYRPAGIKVAITGFLEGYCVETGDTLVAQPDIVNTFLLDFQHVRGTLAVRSEPTGGMFIYLDGEQLYDESYVRLRTPSPSNPDSYTHIKCITTDTTHTVALFNSYGDPCGEPMDTTVAPGETTFVSIGCGGSLVKALEDEGQSRVPRTASPLKSEWGPGELLMQEDMRSIWLLDLGEDAGTEDDSMLLIEPPTAGANFPVISPDQKYIAYIRGEYTSWEIAVAEISGLLEGSGPAVITRIGLPGSAEDVECWRKPESISWLPLSEGRKIVVSLSPCRGGLPDDYGVWVADLDRFLD